VARTVSPRAGRRRGVGRPKRRRRYDREMDTPEPGERRPSGTGDGTSAAPRGRLDRPPGDRFGPQPPAGDDDDRAARSDSRASAARGVAFAGGVAAAGAAVLTLLAGVFAVSVGLVIVAAVIGRFVGLALRAGARSTVTSRRRAMTSAALSVVAVVVAQVAIWAYARSEGGALSLPDYLGQTFGWLVPLQLIAAGVAAWFAAR
jgi:hypothetical protein